MIYEEIEEKIKNSPSLKLFRSKKASLMICFFYKQFKTGSDIVVNGEKIVEELAGFIEKYSFNDDDDEMLQSSSDSVSKAKRLLNNWIDENWIRNYVDENTRQVYYILTKHTERVFQMIEIIREKDFINTESKFKDIFFKLEDIVNNTDNDPDSRIKDLERKKAEIEREIEQIKRKGVVKQYENFQIKSRIEDVYRLTNELVGDFKEVEDNFKDITKNIYEKQALNTFSKGNLLGYAFDSVDKLKESDQGKSFYTFWHFLMNDKEQQNLKNLVERSITTLDERGIENNERFLRRIKNLLYSAGQKVLESNDRLGEKLTRVISEKNNSDNKKSRETIREIRILALKVAEKELPADCGIILELDPEVLLPLERPLAKGKVSNIYDVQPTAATTPVDLQNLTRLYNPRLINRKQLLSNVKETLKTKDRVSLREITELYPIEKGLSEVVAYITLGDYSQNIIVNYDMTESIVFDHEYEKYIDTPQIIYTK